MKTKFNGILTLLLAFTVHFAFAQKTVSGTVSDESGPLPGVSVLIKGTTTGTETDFDGKYALQANAGDVLQFSYIGMETAFKTVGAASVYDVVLKADTANVLDEVVITALGIEKKKDDDLSSSTTVNTEAMGRAVESGVIQSLSGKTSGLKVTKNSGDPGAGAYIQIRGQNTFSGDANPLIILDGTPISNTSARNADDKGGTGGVTQQSRLNDINQEDIESVTVLKGAAAAAVWGAGAANGVIIIKTKRGKTASGKSTSVNIKSTVVFDQINIEYQKQDVFGQGYPAWWFGGSDYSSSNSIWIPNVFASWGDKISARAGGEDVFVVGNERFVASNGNVFYPVATKNSHSIYNASNRDQVFGSGLTIDKSVSISFASDLSNTFISYSGWDQQGIIKGKSNYNRATLRLNHSVKLTDRIKARFNTTYSKINSDRIQQGSNLSGLYLGYLRTPPDFDNAGGYIGTYYNSANVPSLNAHRGFRKHLGDAAPVYNNPGWTINEQDNPNLVNRFILSPEITWDIKDNLVFTARYGIDYYTDHRETYYPVNSAGGTAVGIYQQNDIAEKTQNLNAFLQSNYTLSDAFKFSWILGTSLDQNQFSRITGSSSQFTNPLTGDLRIFGNAEAANETPGSYKRETRKHGVYAALNFDLFDQLFVETTGRYERSSTFNDNVFYPAVSLGWKFSELLEDKDILSFGKIRASYGEIGITPPAYASSTNYNSGGIRSSWGDELLAANYGNPFARSRSLGNPNLKHEVVKEKEFGIDMRLFKNFVSLGVTYYDRLTEDAILRIDMPASTGFTSVLKNAAEITNKGLEVDLGLKLLTEGDFKWSLNANYSHNKNLVTDLSGVKSVFLAGFTGTSSRVVEGHAIGALWGPSFATDDNGNYVLDANGFPTVGVEEGVIGDPNPDWIGGLGTLVSYKGISLSAQFETSQGNDHWTGTEGVLKFFGIHPDTANETTWDTDLITYDGRTIPAGTTFRGNVEDFGGGNVALDSEWYLAEGGGFGNQSGSFIQDASWTRLRELSLRYEFPSKLLNKTGLSNLSISATGRNLILWTKIEGFDPDLNLTGASLGRGLDYFTNPSTKSYAFTIKLGL